MFLEKAKKKCAGHNELKLLFDLKLLHCTMLCIYIIFYLCIGSMSFNQCDGSKILVLTNVWLGGKFKIPM